MCARTHKCEACFEEYSVGRCCEPDSPCGGEEWKSIVNDIQQGLAAGSNAGMIIGGPLSGQVNPCRFCDSYVFNDAASFERGVCQGYRI